MKTDDLQYWGETKVTFHNRQEPLTREERLARQERKRSYKQLWMVKREMKFNKSYQTMIDLPNT